MMKLLSMVAIAVLVAGCSSKGMRFSDALRNGTEATYIASFGGTSAFSTLDSENLQYLCAAYAQNDEFTTSIACYDAHIKRFFSSNSTVDKFTTMNVLWSRAAMAFQVGEYENTISFIDKDFAFMAANGFTADAFLGSEIYQDKLISLHALKLMALHQLGRTDEEEQTVQALQSFVPWIQKQSMYYEPLSSVLPRPLLYSRIATAYSQTGRYEQAADLFRNDEDTTGQKLRSILGGITTFGTSFVTDAIARNTQNRLNQGPYFIGKAALEGGRYDEALRAFMVVEASGVFEVNRFSLWVYLNDYARTHQALGNTDESIRLYIAAIDVFESQRSNLGSEDSRIGFVGDKQAVYASLVAALMSQQRYSEAFAFAERGKARALVDVLASKKSFGGSAAAEQNRLLAELDAAEKKSNMPRAPIDTNNASATRGVVVASRTRVNQQAPEFASLVSVTVPDVSEIQALLPVGETLIEYFGESEQLFAFIVTRDSVLGVELDGKGLVDDVSRFRNAVADATSTDYQRLGTQLHDRLLGPLVSAVESDTITIVPHGVLHYLPFAALSDSQGFLVDQFAIRILPSAAVMQFLKPRQNPTGSLLVLGNPDLGNTQLDLPFAEAEAIRISQQVAGARLLLKAEATESAVKRYGDSFRYLHLASHGTFDSEQPLASGLLLAEDAENNGQLTVAELYDLNLNADLVTLSACETALGKVANGDDVVGFTRGFLFAGARSIVSSLWQVDDAATADLMTGFYNNLDTSDKRSALRAAQIATKSRYQHPYYWAAFQLTGAAS